MAISHKEILHLAKSFVRDSEDEVLLRTAIGRAYYSMFHASHELVGGHIPKVHPVPGKVFKGGTHARLSQYIAYCADRIQHEHIRSLQLLSVKLKMCHKIRCEADYELMQTMHSSQLDNLVKDAEFAQSVLIELKDRVF